MSLHTPAPLAELLRQRSITRNVNVAHRERLSTLERIALSVTRHVGGMGFFLLILCWTCGWLLWNTLAPHALRFDPYPAFVLWLFISNMIQILLMPLIMIGQNLQGRHAEARAESDFEVNLRSEREIAAIIQHLENQDHMMLEIMRRIGTAHPAEHEKIV